MTSEEAEVSKHAQFAAKLAQRDAERKQARSETRQGYGQFLNDDERKASLRAIVKQLESELDKVTSNVQIRDIEEKITQLETRGISKGELAGVRHRLEDLRRQLALGEQEKKQTKKRFAFKKKAKPATDKAPEKPSEEVGTVENSSENEANRRLEELKNSNQFVIKTPGAHDIPEHSDVLIKELHGTPESPITIDISAKPAGTVHIQTMTYAVLKCNVNTSIFLDSVENSEIYVSCQQLRMHTSQNVKVYLDCSTRAIIEDSKEIIFSKLSEDTPEHRWRTNIDDFNWLSKTQHSPNFTTVP